jgi:molybdenum cofactor cytidylyltransferase
MGRPKLILPVRGEPLVRRVVHALLDGGADRVVVAAPPTEIAGAAELALLASEAGAEVVVAPAPTADMRSTVELGLAALGGAEPPEAVLLAPGDSPGLDAAIVRAVVERWRAEPGSLVVPRVGGRKGHPLAMPWPIASEVPGLPEGLGVNALLDRRAALVRHVELADPAALDDLDTPEDYRRWS